MSKITSKLQVTIPKAIAEQYGLEPGGDIRFEPAGDAIRLTLVSTEPVESTPDLAWRLRDFDAATERQQARNARVLKKLGKPAHKDRGWTRESLYQRGLPD